MKVVSFGRGDLELYGNIDDLNPGIYTSDQMFQVSLGRNKDLGYGNVDDLDPGSHSAKQMKHIAESRSLII